MSSAMRATAFAQVPERTKFFKCIESTGLDYVTDASMNVFLDNIVSAGGSVEGTINVVAKSVSTVIDPVPAPVTDVTLAGAVVRDLGRQISVYATNGGGAHLHLVYRQVQLQNSATTEGVSGAAGVWGSHWVLTWSADGADIIQLVRLG